MPLVVTGARAVVRWGYACAAIVSDWTMTRDEAAGVWLLSGQVSEVDPYAVTQGTLRVVVSHTRGEWVWPVVSLQVDGASSMSAVLGRKERKL